MGDGFPLAAIAIKKEICDKLIGKAYFNTFGGNTVACAVGRAVLKAIDEDKCMENIRNLSP